MQERGGTAGRKRYFRKGGEYCRMGVVVLQEGIGTAKREGYFRKGGGYNRKNWVYKRCVCGYSRKGGAARGGDCRKGGWVLRCVLKKGVGYWRKGGGTAGRRRYYGKGRGLGRYYY